MLSVDEALALVVARSGRQPNVPTPLAKIGGLTLAEPAIADADSPPFDKSLVDGFAVRSADLVDGRAELGHGGTNPAGAVASEALAAGSTLQIMTGAPIPAGADAVIMVERSTIGPDGKVLLNDPRFRAGQNIMRRGRELKAGQVVLEPGHLLGAPEAGLLATIGCTLPKVCTRPRLAILTTGDEIVPPDQAPGPGQIRNSNESTLVALAERAGAEVVSLGAVGDDRHRLSERVGQGLQYDILVLTGGVSAGERDYVPGVLAEHNVEKIFHKIDVKPGKPVWFGAASTGNVVFGLPGNPVSVLVCFELFVRTAIRARQQRPDPLPPFAEAELIRDFNYPTDRRTYHPARLTTAGGKWRVEPVDWFGSPDICGVTKANALLVCTADSPQHTAGKTMQVLPLTRE